MKVLNLSAHMSANLAPNETTPETNAQRPSTDKVTSATERRSSRARVEFKTEG